MLEWARQLDRFPVRSLETSLKAPKLQAIDKNTGNHWVTMLPSKPHKRQMTFMQITHSGDKRGTVLTA
jgi:hypothetical protein